MIGMTIKSKLIGAGIFAEYEDSKFWFSKILCIVFWISALIGGPVETLFSTIAKHTTGVGNTLLSILVFLIFIWQMISFIIMLVNFFKWKNVVGPWGRNIF